MAQTKIKAGLFEGIIGNGADGYFLTSNGDGTMTWSSIIINPTVTSLAYPGSVTAADPDGGETITMTGTGFKTGATVTVGGTAAPVVSYVSETQITFTTPAKAAGDYDIVVTNTDTGSATYINGISYNGIPSWTTPTGSLGTFASEETISTITLQAAEPDAGTITFNITSGTLPTGLSLTGADIDGTTSIENADTTYNFTVTATDDESQSTGRSFSITVEKYIVQPLENFTINTYTGNGSTQSIEGKIGTAASFNGSSSYVDLPSIFNSKVSLTVSAWFKTTGTTGTIYVDWSNSGKNIHLQIVAGKIDVSTYYGGPTGLNFNSPLTYNDGLWHNVVVANNIVANTRNTWVDGNLIENNATLPSGTFSNAQYMGIGAQDVAGTWGSFFNGSIDQVRIFDKALSSSEVTTLYGENNTSTTKSTTDIFDDGSAVALYEFEEGAKDTGGVNGYVNGGAIFNGSNSYIHYPDSLINKTSSSISFWLYSKGANAASNDQYVFLYNNSSTGAEFPIILRNNGTSLDFTFGTTPRKTLNLNEWYNVIINFKSNNTQDIYIDGVLLGSTSHTSSMSGTKIWTMGRYNRSGLEGSYLNADIDEFRIYSTNLSTNDIGYIANNDTANIPTANLTSYYKFDGNAVDEQLNNTATPTNVIFNYNGTPANVSFVGTSFQPDLVWIKSRSGVASHSLQDTVRGAGQNYNLYSDNTAYEGQFGVYGYLSSFDTNGFEVIAGAYGDHSNKLGENYVAWCWKAGGAAVSNTDGTITSQVSANQSAGFSIVKYTGNGNSSASFGHGLSQAPNMYIIKRTDSTSDWVVFTTTLLGGSPQNYIILNSTGTAGTASQPLPDSSVINVQPAFDNINNATYIAYCFHSVDGYQKVGTYTGSGASGNVINVGFEPRFLLTKSSSDTAYWYILDNVRNASNPRNSGLFPNDSLAEITNTNYNVDFNSNGFTLQNNTIGFNQSGETYIYLAIA